MLFKGPIIEFQNVSITFENDWSLSDISFKLERGQMICITGASGSGKSVLLRLASGLLVPDEGRVLVEGREIGHLSENELLALRSATMGIVFQEPSLFTGMSVFENTSYRLDEHGWPEEDIENAVHEILRFVGLEEDIDKLPEELSIGMGRRLEFARALVGWPEIMLFDEATSGLDPVNARIMLDLIIRARDVHNISALYVTKELHEIPYLAVHCAVQKGQGEIFIQRIDSEPAREVASKLAGKVRVMVLDEGRTAFTGAPDEFESTSLPEVMRLTHPGPSAPQTDTYITDPWRHKTKPEE
jgi:phospholipid/cholesterol/gamma-HCH transport system ATP-binding protein